MKVISAKRWSYRLKGKEAAKSLNSICSQYLDTTDHLVISMAGVKNLSQGFAFECFGPLFLEARGKEKRLTFDCVDEEELRDIIIKGIHSYIALRSADSGSAR
jgi:hypothetical protein